MGSKQLLDEIKYPWQLRKLSLEHLPELCSQLRSKTIEIVEQTGGHLGGGLGVIELTVALHYVYDTPNDKLIWDIGHQAYPHKILTGRADKMLSIRQQDGLSGFCKRTESEYDHFGAGHCSTSLSAAYGMAKARDLKGEQHNIVAVIGDGAMSAGMAYEALNNIGADNSQMLIILNNNNMSISPAVGALSQYLAKITTSKPYKNIRNTLKHALKILPSSVSEIVKKTEQIFKNSTKFNNLFDDLGLYSIGPVDGHDVISLVNLLKSIKDDKEINSPILLHLHTEKGKGYRGKKEHCNEKFHAIKKSIISSKKDQLGLSFSQIMGKYLSFLAKNDSKIVAITAAMESGTGLTEFANMHPDNFFDVGIAEQHAVTFAAGLACEGLKPFVAIYSTFLQRAYDQLVHDVAIQNLPVKFLIDRSGLVGADGATHAGSFDLTYLGTLPNMVIMSPSNGKDFMAMLNFAVSYNQSPIAIRYPKGDTEIKDITDMSDIEPIKLGKGKFYQQALDNGKPKIAILAIGTMLDLACNVVKKITYNYDVTVFDLRFAKPLDEENLKKIFNSHQLVISLEENSIGGVSAQLWQLINQNIWENPFYYKPFYLPDKFIDHATHQQQLMCTELNLDNIVNYIHQKIKI